MASSQHVKSASAAQTQPLLSHSSILILSVFLIGFVSGQTLEPDVRLYSFLAGWVGVAIYFAADILRERSRRKAQRLAARNLSNRVDRHVPR
jgi:hypothetical protein